MLSLAVSLPLFLCLCLFLCPSLPCLSLSLSLSLPTPSTHTCPIPLLFLSHLSFLEPCCWKSSSLYTAACSAFWSSTQPLEPQIASSFSTTKHLFCTPKALTRQRRDSPGSRCCFFWWLLHLFVHFCHSCFHHLHF